MHDLEQLLYNLFGAILNNRDWIDAQLAARKESSGSGYRQGENRRNPDRLGNLPSDSKSRMLASCFLWNRIGTITSTWN
jgi:hypothetical protein